MARKKMGKGSLFNSVIADHQSLHEFDSIDELIDWKKINDLFSTIYSSKIGGASYPPLMMFKALLLQTWHRLSDPQTEKMLSRDLLFRRFCDLSIMDTVPDHSTISRFRNQLHKENLYTKLLDEINEQLAKKGAIIKFGEISILDATVIEAHQCRKKPGVDKENTQDSEAGWSVKKGSKGREEFIFGYKSHTNVDEDGYVKVVEVTAGNVHDSQKMEDILTGTEERVYADSAYVSESNAEKLRIKGIKNEIHARAYRNKPLTTEEKELNKNKSSIRYIVEGSFGAMKRHYGMGKTRFLGLIKTECWVTVIAMAFNLKKAAIMLKTEPPEPNYA